jgi:hypothetical protein
MENNNFKELFEQIKQFKDIQEKQKQRGLNNYNIFTTISKNSNENNHSKMIASFLNPSGEHYQSTLFLDKFLEVLNINEFNIKTDSCSVCREYKNIDIYITDGNKHIIIENKIYAKDQHRQIERYINEIRKDNKELEPNDILVMYLSLDREIPTQYSLGDLKIEDNKVKRNSEDIALFKSIHYKKEILDWLENCKYEVQNITNLNEVFRQYIDVVKMITNKYKEKIMNLKDELLKNKEWFNLAKDISMAYEEAEKEIINNKKEEFFITIQENLIEYEYEKLKWGAIDILNLNYLIRLIPEESNILIQVADKTKAFEIVNRDKKNKILPLLKQINNNFQSSYNKVYGALRLEYNDIDKIENIIGELKLLK